MRRILFLVLFILVFVSCKTENKVDNHSTSLFESESPTDFNIRFAKDSITKGFIRDSIIFGSGASVSIKNIDGLDALEVRTNSEFSDAFLNLEKLFGHTIDFSKAKYVSMKLWVPNESWITALKLNFKDTKGNFGGCDEITNNFYGNYNQWINVVIDMQEVIPEFKNWHGEESPLPKTKYLSLNPYNAHQADSSSIYIHSLKLSDEKPHGDFTEALVQRPEIIQNNPYTITFDDEELLHRQMAIRAFESTYQAMSKNIAGNSSMAIRLKGKENNTHLAFLPILDKLTSAPVDFTKVKRLHFSYYLTEDSDDFDGAILFLANQHWENVLIEPQIYKDFQKGQWFDVSIDLEDFNFQEKEGSSKVMPNVYEIRLGLNYRPNLKNIEMWLDNFGWE